MSTLANITSLNLSLQTGGAALAVNAVKSVAKPERTVYVFGTADDVAPNFTTVDGAVTYARSLVPLLAEPVVIRLFTKLDGTPYDLDGGDSWIVYAFEHIYIYSDFKRLNTITDELPTSLPPGLTIWYIDPNGVETLWVGREDGSAWPAVGYKEYTARVTYSDPDITVSVLKNDIGSVVWTRLGEGSFRGTLSGAFVNNNIGTGARYALLKRIPDEGQEQYIRFSASNNTVEFDNYIDDVVSDSEIEGIIVSILMYP
jgi:hypothetical protein